jgi:hypothetical protein
MSRAQVRADLRQSKQDGSYDLAHQEYQGQLPSQGGHGGFRLAHTQ